MRGQAVRHVKIDVVIGVAEQIGVLGQRVDRRNAQPAVERRRQRDGQLIPIEVKSADNTRAKSLKVYMDTYKPAYAIKLSAKNFGFEDNKKIVPLYAAFCI